jgi:hypothetical protein
MYAILLRGPIILLEQDLKETHDFAASRLERKAKRRCTTANLLLAWIIEVLGVEDIYGAVLDDAKTAIKLFWPPDVRAGSWREELAASKSRWQDLTERTLQRAGPDSVLGAVSQHQAIRQPFAICLDKESHSIAERRN